MTIEEVRRRYRIPAEILKEYESWDSGKTAGQETEERQYDDSDLEKLSLMMTLRETGFTPEETKVYVRLQTEGERTGKERLQMLNKKRSSALDELHVRQKQLDTLDYLRHRIREK